MLTRQRTSSMGVKEAEIKWTGYKDLQWIPEADIRPGDLRRLLSEKATRERRRGRFAAHTLHDSV